MKTLLSIVLLGTLSFSDLGAEALHLNAVKDLLQAGHRMVDEVTPIQLKQMIDGDGEFILIDIREPDQVQRGEIFHVDLHKITRGYLEFKIEPIVPDNKTPIIVYCCTGKRSILAAQQLKQMGYQNVRSLQGGIQHWVEMGLPLFTAYGEMTMLPHDYDAEAVYTAMEKEKEALKKAEAAKKTQKKSKSEDE